MKDRWGGWYVTGIHGDQTHLGNAILPDGAHAEQLDKSAGANLADLSGRLDTSAYLTKYSDIVAHLVLAHQTQMHNLITQTNYQTRLALYARRSPHPEGRLAGGDNFGRRAAAVREARGAVGAVSAFRQ